jgi:Xaa-Pro aminopeptidase
MRAREIDAILLSSWNRLDINCAYLAGCTVEHNFLVYGRDRTMLLVPGMEVERARRGTKATIVKLERDYRSQLASILRKMGVRRLGLNLSFISYAEYKAIRKAFKGRIVDAGKLLLETRREKSAKELATYKKACRLTDMIMQKTVKSFGFFRSEQDVYSFLRDETEKAGCTFSFEPIIASGKKASMPHSDQRGRLEKGFCVIDYGLKYKGYCTDITRTVFIGKPTREEIGIYNKVLDVQVKAIRMCNKDVGCNEVHDFAAKELGSRLTHSLGHGIGLQIHELPSISPSSKERFVENMVFTIEPGAYVPGKYGIRIEDDLTIRNGKAVLLTHAPKDLICVRKG